MLLIEIVLTVIAWFKGWKWYSLIPIGSAFFIGALFTIASGGEIPNLSSVAVFDVLAIIALIIMCFTKPKPKT